MATTGEPIPPTAGAATAAPHAAPGASVARHYFRYLNAQLINSVAGLISFPIMARLLSKEQFGILSYFEMFPLLWIAFLKLGTQHSIVRFYPIYGMSPEHERRREFYASLVSVPALLSTGLCVVTLLVLFIVNRFSPVDQVQYLYLILILGQIGVLGSLTDNVMRARELSKKSSTVSVCGRYLDLVFVLGMVYLTHTAFGYYVGKLTSGLIVFGYLMWWLLRNTELNLGAFKPAMFKESLSFGLPMVISEISLILLAFADRIMINKYLPGDAVYVKEQLGLYGIGYMLAMYLGTFIRTSLTSAYQPVANRLYQQQGAASVRRFKHKLLKILVYVSIPMAAGLLLTGREVVHIVAGLDKIDAAPVFVWVGINYALIPIFNVAAYGLILIRKTGVIAWVVLVSALLNVALNFMWIPRFGIMGAVYATLVAYAFMGLYQIFKCPRELRSFPTLREVSIPTAAALAWAAGVWGLDLTGVPAWLARVISHSATILPHGKLEDMAREGSLSVAHVIVTAAMFIALYLLPCWRMDGDLRTEILKRLGRK